MQPIRTPILLVIALVAAALPMTPTALADDDTPTLSPACEDALLATREALLAQRQTISFPDAVALLQREAGAVCGFDLYAGDAGGVRFPASDGPLKIAAPQNIGFVPPDVGVPGIPIGLTEKVPCAFPGGGGGTITASVLGIPLETVTAQGVWYPVEETFEVSGEGAPLSGIQADSKGIMRVAAAIIPALDGETNGECVLIEETTTVTRTCWNLVVWVQCSSTAVVSVRLALCGATADQDLAGLITYRHEYIADDAPEEC